MSDAATRWGLVKEIVGEACERPPGERAALVADRCGDDTSLREEVESLLAASESSDALLHPQTDAWLGSPGPGASLPSGGRLGGFEIERVLAESPGSAVYSARQAGSGRRIALKVMRSLPLLEPDPRFWTEASAASRVEHPNVVRVYESGMLEAAPGHRLPYIAMELVDGVPVTRYVAQERPGVWRVVGLIRKIASGVARIHQCGVIHRDLKPSNVLVDGAGEPRVLDFGVARMETGPGATLRTLDSLTVGTPGYISPEQITDPAGVDIRADVWSLGVLSYEMLSGVHPFAADGGVGLLSLRRVLEEDPMPLRRRAPHIPADVEAVVMKAMSRRREDRYDTASAFAEDLASAERQRPVRARRATAWYRLRTFARRRAVPLAVGAVVTGVLLTGALLQVISWREASRERDRAAAALGMIRGMISSADPNFGNRDTLMRDALLGLERDLTRTTEPLIEAEVRSLLGGLTFSLGEYERSLAHLERAIALRESHESTRSAEATLDRAALAQTLRWLYRLDEAMETARAALREATARFGESHAATLVCRAALAGCLHDAGRLDEAEREFRQLADAWATTEGPQSRGTLLARGQAASVLLDAARYAEAEAELRSVLEGWDDGPGSPEAITNRSNLALAVAHQGRPGEAADVLDRVVADAERALGPTHPTTISALANRNEFVRRAGREDEALDQSAALVERCRAAFGWGHDLTVSAVTGRVASLVRAGRGDQAVTLAEEALAGCVSASPADALLSARLSASLAGALGAAGRRDEALAVYAASIERLTSILGPTHRQTLTARNNLGVALIDAGRPADAVVEARQVLNAVVEAGFGEMESVVRRNLGRALLAAGETAEGLIVTQGAFAMSVERGELANAAVCAGLLAEHYEEVGDAVSAEAWRARASP